MREQRRKLILILGFGLCLILVVFWLVLQRERKADFPAPRLETLIAETVKANRFWLTLPYKDVSYRYRLTMQFTI